jgi:hypothetical protein
VKFLRDQSLHWFVLTSFVLFVLVSGWILGSFAMSEFRPRKMTPAEVRIESEERRRQLQQQNVEIEACEKRGGAAAMGFGFRVVCVQEFRP